MKKIYIVPETKKLTYRTESLLYTVSIWYGGEDDNPTIDAKESIFDEESDCAYNLPSSNIDVWAEEEEDDQVFKFSR